MRQEKYKNKTGRKNTQRYRYLVIKMEKISRFGLLKTLINTYFCRKEKKIQKKKKKRDFLFKNDHCDDIWISKISNNVKLKS
jgi:hypothetical protein